MQYEVLLPVYRQYVIQNIFLCKGKEMEHKNIAQIFKMQIIIYEYKNKNL